MGIIDGTHNDRERDFHPKGLGARGTSQDIDHSLIVPSTHLDQEVELGQEEFIESFAAIAQLVLKGRREDVRKRWMVGRVRRGWGREGRVRGRGRREGRKMCMERGREETRKENSEGWKDITEL